MNTRDDCHVEPINKAVTDDELAQESRVLFEVLGMGCVNCATRVRNSIIGLHGVVSAEVDHMRGLADVSYNPGLTTVEEMVQVVAQAGGDARHEYRAFVLP